MLIVSTHAPAWGAICRTTLTDVTTSFNSRARMGRDIRGGNYRGFKIVSTHAPAWGAMVLLIFLVIVLIISSYFAKHTISSLFHGSIMVKRKENLVHFYIANIIIIFCEYVVRVNPQFHLCNNESFRIVGFF